MSKNEVKKEEEPKATPKEPENWNVALGELPTGDLQ
jgi:hypothetical protein